MSKKNEYPYPLREFSFVAKVTVSNRPKGRSYRITIPQEIAELMQLKPREHINVKIRKLKM